MPARRNAGLPDERNHMMETIPFRVTVPAGVAGFLVAVPAADATIEKITLRIYPGPEQALIVTPTLWHDNFDEPLFRFGVLGGGLAGAVVKNYFDGDDDEWILRLCRPCGPHDQIRVYINNTAILAYDVACDVLLDYAGGRYPAGIAPFLGRDL